MGALNLALDGSSCFCEMAHPRLCGLSHDDDVIYVIVLVN